MVLVALLTNDDHTKWRNNKLNGTRYQWWNSVPSCAQNDVIKVLIGNCFRFSRNTSTTILWRESGWCGDEENYISYRYRATLIVFNKIRWLTKYSKHTIWRHAEIPIKRHERDSNPVLFWDIFWSPSISFWNLDININFITLCLDQQHDAVVGKAHL